MAREQRPWYLEERPDRVYIPLGYVAGGGVAISRTHDRRRLIVAVGGALVYVVRASARFAPIRIGERGEPIRGPEEG